MTAAMSATVPADARARRYLEAERRVWDQFGLDPIDRFVTVGSPPHQLRVVEVGAGDPLLFTHGTVGGGPAWAPLVSELRGFRCLLMDRPGFGLSSPIRYTAATFAETVARVQRDVLDALGIEGAPVVGGSIGCVWALRLAQRHAERVDRVVLLGGGPIAPIPIPRAIGLLASPLGLIMLQALKRQRVVRAMIRGSGHGASLDDGRIGDAFVAWRTAVNRHTDSMRHERAMIRELVAGGGFQSGVTLSDVELAGIQQPTLMVIGTADDAGAAATWQRVTGLMPRGRLALVDGAGHMPWLDDPARVAQEMQRFLGRSVSSTPDLARRRDLPDAS